MSVLSLTHTQTEKAALFYKLCANIVKLQELSDGELLRLSTFTKLYKNNTTKEIRWSADWIAMGLKLSKAEHKQLWHKIAEHVMQAPVDPKKLPGKTIKIDYTVFVEPELGMLEFVQDNESVSQNVYNIYEATGKVVHALKLEDFIAGKVPARPSEQVIQLMKSLKLPMEELTEVQRYITNSTKSSATGFRAHMLQLPKELQELRDKILAKPSMILAPIDLTNEWGYKLAKLGLRGYTLALIEPHLNAQGDIAYHKSVDLFDITEMHQVSDEQDYAFGLASTRKPASNRPVLSFMDTWGHYKLNKTKYINGIMEHYKDNREVIQKYLQTPKHFYIKRTDKYEWDNLAISLDILHNENLSVHPDTFSIITNKFQGKEPMEWINEI
ncbi:hypothetical protein DIREPILLOW8_203 [Vibrio phage Direpillow8]|nr:hypothetical protein DIREPILLOW8_203 [Vibrio phage Direpillow8]